MTIEPKGDAPNHDTGSPLCWDCMAAPVRAPKSACLHPCDCHIASLPSQGTPPSSCRANRRCAQGLLKSEARPGSLSSSPRSSCLSASKATRRVEIVFSRCSFLSSRGNQVLPLGEKEKQAASRGHCCGTSWHRCHTQLCPVPATSSGASGQHGAQVRTAASAGGVSSPSHPTFVNNLQARCQSKGDSPREISL